MPPPHSKSGRFPHDDPAVTDLHHFQRLAAADRDGVGVVLLAELGGSFCVACRHRQISELHADARLAHDAQPR